MPKKICNDGCGCDKCKTTTKKKKTKSKPKRGKTQIKQNSNVIMDMRMMTIQPNNTVPSQFNTPKDILDIKNSLIELLQKEKKKLSGVISTQTEDMYEIVDDIATEAALENVSEFRPFKRENKLINHKSTREFNKGVNTYISPPAPPPPLPEKYNAFHNETFDAEILGRSITPLEIRRSFPPPTYISPSPPSSPPPPEKFKFFQSETFDAEVPDTIVKPFEKHKSQKTNTILFENSSSPITTGNAVFEETFDAEYKPKLPKSEEKFNGFKTSSDKFFATPQTSFKADNKYNNPNIYIPPIPPPPPPEEFKLKDGKIKVKRMPRLSQREEQNMFKNEDKPEHKPQRGRPKGNHSLIRIEDEIL